MEVLNLLCALPLFLFGGSLGMSERRHDDCAVVVVLYEFQDLADGKFHCGSFTKIDVEELLVRSKPTRRCLNTTKCGKTRRTLCRESLNQFHLVQGQVACELDPIVYVARVLRKVG